MGFRPKTQAVLPDIDQKPLKFVPKGASQGQVVTEIGEFDDKPNAFFQGISDRFDTFKRASQPPRPATRDEEGNIVPEIRQTPNVIGKVRGLFERPETLAPLTTLTHQAAAGVENPLLGVPARAGAIAATPVTGAIDAIGDVFSLARESAAGALGEDPALSATARIQRGLETDRGAGQRAQESTLNTIQPDIDKMIQAGQDPEEIKKALVPLLFNAGFTADIAEGLAIESIFRGATALRTGAQRSKTLAQVKDFRKATAGERFPVKEPLKFKIKKQVDVAPKDIIEKPGPIRGKGFVIKEPQAATPAPKLLTGPASESVAAPKFVPKKTSLTNKRGAISPFGDDIGAASAKPAKASESGFQVIDTQTGKPVTGVLKSRKAARNKADKFDNQFGRAKHTVKAVNKGKLTSTAGEAGFEGAGKKKPLRAKDLLKKQKARVLKNREGTVGAIIEKAASKSKGIGDELKIEIPVVTETVDKAGRKIKKSVGGTKVGSMNLGKAVKEGRMTERHAQVLVAVDKANPILSNRIARISNAEIRASVGSPEIRKVLDVVENSDVKSLAALHDTPVSQALAIAKRALDEGKPIENVMNEIAQDLLVARKVSNILGVNLQAIRRSVATADLEKILVGQLKRKNLTDVDRKVIRESLELIGSKQARSRLVRSLDMVTEFGINAMLSSPVTFVRNLAGSAVGVSTQIPQKITQAAVSNIARILRIPQSERTFFREVGPEIAGLIQGTLRGLRKGKRFLQHEDVARVFRHVEQRVKTVKSKHIPKGQAFSTLKRNQKARLLRELREDMRDLLTEEEVTRAAELGFRRSTRSIESSDPGLRGKVINKIGEIVNLPVRGLVATDKVFQTASASGHIAARRIREAILQKKSVKNIRLTRGQIDEAKTDAMFYVFRQKLGPNLSKVQNLISDTPLMPLMIPFLKSRINFAKFALKNSPFGAVETLWKGFATRKFDTKSAARAINGTATLLGMNMLFDKVSDNVQIQPAASNQAEREVLRESGLGEQVIVFGTNLNDPKKRKVTHTEPYANLAPVSAPLEVIGLAQEFKRKKAQGWRPDEAFAKTVNKGLRGVLNQSAFGSVKDFVRAAENMADSSIALDKDGNPEVSTFMGILKGPVLKTVNRKIAGVTIPNVVRDITKLNDKRIYDPKGLLQTLRADLPFGDKSDIRTRKTIFDTDAKRTQKRLPFNPLAQQDIDPTIAEMARLEVFPSKTPKRLSASGLRIQLTEKEQDRFNFLGPQLKKTLDGIVKQKWYKDSDDLIKATILEGVIKEFRKEQTKVIKTKGLLRLLQSKEGIQQMLMGVTKGRQFTPFQPKK